MYGYFTDTDTISRGTSPTCRNSGQEDVTKNWARKTTFKSGR